MISGAIGHEHALAQAEDGLVCAWGEISKWSTPGDPYNEWDILPTPVESLRGVRVGGIACADLHNYAAADTGELWAWGSPSDYLFIA